MYIHLLCLSVKQDFRLVIELEIYLGGNARDAWVSSSFRDDLGLGKRRCGRTKLDSGRIVGYPELITPICEGTKTCLSFGVHSIGPKCEGMDFGIGRNALE